MRTDHTLTGEQLREKVVYDPRTGTICHRDPRPKEKRGPLGAPMKTGYIRCVIDQSVYLVHRLVWLYHHDEWPAGEIDHINGIRDDNRIENLRVVSRLENTQNRTHRGCCEQRPGRWQARITVNGKRISLGYFASQQEATAAYLKAKVDLHPSWTSGQGSAGRAHARGDRVMAQA